LVALAGKCLAEVLNGFRASEIAGTFTESAYSTNESNDEMHKPFTLFNVMLNCPLQNATHPLCFPDGPSKNPARVGVQQTRPVELVLNFRMAGLTTTRWRLGIVHQSGEGSYDRVRQRRG
jgi:hypothetical protein